MPSFYSSPSLEIYLLWVHTVICVKPSYSVCIIVFFSSFVYLVHAMPIYVACDTSIDSSYLPCSMKNYKKTLRKQKTTKAVFLKNYSSSNLLSFNFSLRVLRHRDIRDPYTRAYQPCFDRQEIDKTQHASILFIYYTG